VTAARTGDLVELYVTDEGPGLSDRDRERAFDRFWQAAAHRDGDRGRFGLGLAIVRQLLLADGGSIEPRPAASTGLDVVVRVRAGEPGSSGTAPPMAPPPP
jgi:two-component system, OmpR family, sensor kinase